MSNMKILEISNLREKQLCFIYEIHKQIEMRCALSETLLGIKTRRPTANEVKTLIISRYSGAEKRAC